MIDILRTDQFNAEKVVDEMMQVGAASVPLLTERASRILLQQAQGYRYTFHHDARYCSRLVRMEGVFGQLKGELEGLINGPIKQSPRKPLDDDVYFNRCNSNKYLVGGYTGVHVDWGFRGVIAIVVLKGQGKFFASPAPDVQDYEATKRELSSNPGDIIFMRGLGFMGSKDPVFHEVVPVIKQRYSLIYRCDLD